MSLHRDMFLPQRDPHVFKLCIEDITYVQGDVHKSLSIQLSELSQSLSTLATSARMQKHRPRIPGGLVVRILGFHCPGSIPGLGAEILQASRCEHKQIQKPTDLVATF